MLRNEAKMTLFKQILCTHIQQKTKKTFKPERFFRYNVMHA